MELSQFLVIYFICLVHGTWKLQTADLITIRVVWLSSYNQDLAQCLAHGRHLVNI